MSKFAAVIDATITGDRKVKPLNHATVKLETGKVSMPLGICTAVKIGAKFENIVYIDDYEMSINTDAMRQSLVAIKRAMVEEMFGEFRPFLLEANAATYDGDMTRLRTILANIEDAMFRDGI